MAVSHTLEGKSELISLSKSKFKDEIALLPHWVTTLRICDRATTTRNDKKYTGHFCCQLPIADLHVGLPLLLQSFFTWRVRETIFYSRHYQHFRAVIQGPLTESLIRLIIHIRDRVGVTIDWDIFFSLIELKRRDSSIFELTTFSDGSTTILKDMVRSIKVFSSKLKNILISCLLLIKDHLKCVNSIKKEKHSKIGMIDSDSTLYNLLLQDEQKSNSAKKRIKKKNRKVRLVSFSFPWFFYCPRCFHHP